MINRSILVGRLTADPELRTTANGKDVVSFSIAVNRAFKSTDGVDADFFRVVAWGQTATFVAEYIGKARLVAVDGRLQVRKWQDSNGNSRESVELVADHVRALDRAKDDAGQAKQSTSSMSAAYNNQGDYDPFEDQ